MDMLSRIQARVKKYEALSKSTSSISRPCLSANIDWSLPTVRLVPVLSPQLEAPTHLTPYANELDKAIERSRVGKDGFTGLCFACPPQHGKTATTEHGLVKALITLPGKAHAYATYAHNVTMRVQAETRRICEAIGLTIEGTQNHWWIPSTKSSVRWTSIGGPLTSDPVSGLLILDDPFRDYPQARSIVERERRWDWLVQVALRRLHPGASLFTISTRWTPDDVTGRAIKRLGWRYINLKAICDSDDDPLGRVMGEALWHSQRPLDFLQLQKAADPFSFAAQYQGDPRDLGSQLFHEPDRFIDLPSAARFRTAYGVDLAYSEKTISDWSVWLRGRRIEENLYILGCKRKQQESTAFMDELKLAHKIMKGSMRFYSGGGGEKGVSSFFSRELPGFKALPASADKVTRSTKAREGWNLKRVLVPDPDSPFYGPWVEDFVNEVVQFTGVGDRNDDQVDALSALWDELMGNTTDWDAIKKLQAQVPGLRM